MAFYHLLALELQNTALGQLSDAQGCLQSRDELRFIQKGNTSRKDAECSLLCHCASLGMAGADGSVLVLLPS